MADDDAPAAPTAGASPAAAPDAGPTRAPLPALADALAANALDKFARLLADLPPLEAAAEVLRCVLHTPRGADELLALLGRPGVAPPTPAEAAAVAVVAAGGWLRVARGAVAGLRRPVAPRSAAWPLWKAVAQRCSLGGTAAGRVCVALGHDPDEKVARNPRF